MSRLGDTIQKARIKARMTEKALGKKCGLAESFIKDVESACSQRPSESLGARYPSSS